MDNMKFGILNKFALKTIESISITDNNDFCKRIFNNSFRPSLKIDSLLKNSHSDFYNSSPSLVYSKPHGETNNDNSSNSDVIVNLLMQLKTCQSDQNISIQNKTIVKNQLEKQLNRELLFAKNEFSNIQIKKIENAVVNKIFDGKSFDNLIKSIADNKVKKKDDIVKLFNSNYYLFNDSKNLPLEVVKPNIFSKFPVKLINENISIENEILNRYNNIELKTINKALETRVVDSVNLINRKYNTEEIETKTTETDVIKQLKEENKLRRLITKENISNLKNISIENEILNRYNNIELKTINKALETRVVDNVKLINKKNVVKNSILNSNDVKDTKLITINNKTKDFITKINEKEIKKQVKAEQTFRKLINNKNELTLKNISIENEILSRYNNIVTEIIDNDFEETIKNHVNFVNKKIEHTENNDEILKYNKEIQQVSVNRIKKSLNKILNKVKHKYKISKIKTDIINRDLLTLDYKIKRNYKEKELNSIVDSALNKNSILNNKINVLFDDEIKNELSNPKTYYKDSKVQTLQENVKAFDRQINQEDFVYRKTIKALNNNAQEKNNEQKDAKKILDSQLVGNRNKEAKQNFSNNTNFYKDSPLNNITRYEAEQLIDDYINKSDISADAIFKEVMERFEKVLKVERRRLGI